MLDGTKIVPMMKNYLGDEVSSTIGAADWFRVWVDGKWIADCTDRHEAFKVFRATINSKGN